MTALEPEVSRRLHPSSLIFGIGALARGLLVPGVLAFWGLSQSDETRWEYWIMLFFIPLLGVQIFKYVTLRYRFDRDELVVKKGLVFRNERHIPFGRIQNVDLVQNPLHRLLKVAQVRIETASGTRPEAVLSVLSMTAVHEMRRRIFDEHAADAVPEVKPGAPEPLVQVSFGELVLLGIISNRAAPLLAIGMGFLWELNIFERVELVDDAVPYLEQIPVAGQVAGGVLVAGLIITLLFLLSVAWTIIRLYGFKLIPVGDDMRLECGLFTRRAATIPRGRIQLICIRETIVHRWLGYVTIRIETAGGSGSDDDSEQAISQKWFVPLIAKTRVASLLDRLGLPLDAGRAHWQPPAAGARRRLLARRMLAAALVGAVAGVVSGGWGALALLVLLPLAVIHGCATAANLAWARTEHGLYFRSGVLSRKVSATFFEKVQTVMSLQSPFDRRHGHARLIVDTAGAGAAGHSVHIPYLPVDTANDLRDMVATEAEQSEFRW